jgi:hypothetical protein
MNTLLHELKGVKSTVNEIAPVTGTQANVAVLLHEADTRIAKLEALLTTQHDLADMNTKVYIYIYIYYIFLYYALHHIEHLRQMHMFYTKCWSL